MLPDIQPGNTKILYFFNCLLDGMHTTFIYCERLLCLRQIRIYQETFSQISSLESEKFSATILAISIK